MALNDQLLSNADTNGTSSLKPAGYVDTDGVTIKPVTQADPLPVDAGLTAYTEDDPAAANPAGGVLILVRRDALTAAEVSADGDNVAAKGTAKGELCVNDAALAALIGEVQASPTANTVLDRLKTIATALSTLQGYTDGLEALAALTNGYVDGLEALSTSTNSLLTTQAGYLDGLEGFVDGVETLLTAISGKLPAALGAAAGANSMSVVPNTDTPFPIVVGLTGNYWSYAAATGGIVNSASAVTIKTAAGASVRNYITGLQIDFDALGAATEVAIRDGAAGTVLWRMKIPIGAAGQREIVFQTPLKGSANTLLEVVTLTASATGGVFVNAQGYTGA